MTGPIPPASTGPDPTGLDRALAPLDGRAPSGANGYRRVAGAPPARPARARAELDEWDRRVAGGLAFLRRRLTGEYEVDEFGFDKELTDQIFHPVLRPLYRDWFRTEVSGVEHLPVDGPALVVANHSGTIALDATLLALCVHDETPNNRYLRLLGADLIFRLPFVSEMTRKSGSTLACHPDAERLLRAGELVGVFPEGFKGIGKGYAERYKLQRFGRGGFVSAALRTGTPIVPVAIVGAEETYPMIGNIKPLARLLGTPYFPVTPTFPWLGLLGLIPLPAKWMIHFGEPIPTEGYEGDADDPSVIFNLADLVRERIQAMVHELLVLRGDPFGLGR